MDRRITRKFNMALLAFIIVRASYFALFKPVEKGILQTQLGRAFESSVFNYIFIVMLLFLVALLLLFTCSRLLLEFWNRFIADSFKIRLIEFEEALSIILMAKLLFP